MAGAIALSPAVGIGFVWYTGLAALAGWRVLGDGGGGAGKAADLKTEIRATGLRRSWAYKLLI